MNQNPWIVNFVLDFVDTTGAMRFTHGIQNLVEAMLACHPSPFSEWLAGWQFRVSCDVCAQTQLTAVTSGPFYDCFTIKLSFFLSPFFDLFGLLTGEALIYSHIHHVVSKVFLPQPGRITEVQGPVDVLYYRSSATDNLPTVDFPLKFLLETFSVDDVLLLLK